MNLREAARLVLSEALLPMSARDVWAEMVRRGLDKKVGPKGKTPDAAVGAYLYVSAKNPESGIIAQGKRPALFRLARRNPPSAKPQTLPTTPNIPKTKSNEPNRNAVKKTSPAKSGWVYILTNPSFREDWVKIGKSSRPVDVRSKELDNTAVPLPFEIFATLKTAKYAIVEQNIHNVIDALTKLRIRSNREFFNITPERALNLLEKEARLLDDAELVRYEKNIPIVSAPLENEWRTTRRGIVGRMRISDGQYEVLPGSDICMGCKPVANEKVQKLRMSLLRSGHITQMAGGGWKLGKSVFFKSPSSAAVFVLGGSQNGWTEWKNSEGKALQSVREGGE